MAVKTAGNLPLVPSPAVSGEQQPRRLKENARQGGGQVAAVGAGGGATWLISGFGVLGAEHSGVAAHRPER